LIVPGSGSNRLLFQPVAGAIAHALGIPSGPARPLIYRNAKTGHLP
jgi:hypothetical protein